MAEAVKAQKAPSRPAEPNLNDPALYINRELSLLDFQQRVLAQAREKRHPLLDRLRFLAIVANNLDEFFMVRISDLQDLMDAGLVALPPDAMTPAQQLAATRKRIVVLLEEQRRILHEDLLPDLADQNIRVVGLQDLSVPHRAGLRTYFEQQVFPVLTPLAVDPGHPFPHISNLSVNLAVELRGEGPETLFARVKIPDTLPRLLNVEAILGQHTAGKRAKYTFVWLDDLIAANLSTLFHGIPVLAHYPFRVIRDADIEIHEEEGADLRVSVEQGLRRRKFGEPVALMVEHTMPERMRAMLMRNLVLEPESVYAVDRPLGLESLMQLYALDRPDLKYPPLVPRLPPTMAAGESIFSVLDRHDVLLHHPYDSFAPVVDLLSSAARDPDVLAIKQTLYRVGTDSPVVEALLDAVNHGKQVAVLVELKARFDEASNIEWASELERAGVHVVYGFVGWKTHAKVALVVRKEPNGIRRYVHVGSGNYNPQTARGYTDVGLLTSDPDFGADATDLFNYLTGYSKQATFRRFLLGPLNLRKELIDRIEREVSRHRNHGDGHIIFKINHLADREFMHALYRASEAGVKIDLIVRTICSLRPGLPRISEKIRVISLVGRFLEHSRIYYFHNGNQPEVLAGSADLLPRNLDHRIEVLFPILEPDIRERVVGDILHNQLRDTANAWELHPDGTWARVRPKDGQPPFDSQAWAIEHG
ncbi:MAG: polyphosphate kinase 1 [Chloroflexota bacterium]|nr:polyphosphate kinase 1 [Chloroflexota bacterium]